MRSLSDFLLFSFLSTITISSTLGALCSDHEKGEGYQNPADGVCSNIDIRITIDQFKRLQNCTVVEGFLHISLIERARHEDYEKWSFPELREITGYIRLYRVYELRTLRHLFPNLTVIGGRQLFNNYALVVYEMPDLEELGLISLRTISRGGVRITKSKKLCYLDTIDWGRLGVDSAAQDFKDNKEESQCANYCPGNCPTTKAGSMEVKRCWTSQHCQLGLNCRCKMNQSCMDNGTCCHDFCVGGCVGPGLGDCNSCKGVTYKGRCHPKCPPDTYMFSDRRCLTKQDCLAMANNTKGMKILQGETGEPNICVTACPQNYTIREEGELKNLECVKCQGFCPKVCNSTDVNSIEDAEKLKDCSKIIGSLNIQIMSGSNVVQEMEKNLGSIKEVTGHISIKRSYALLTLYFLKSLEAFGSSLSAQDQGLTVMDNSNLEELFPEEQMKKMMLKHGKVSFHNNRKLCLYKIKNLVKHLNLSKPPTEEDISRASNGDLVSCSEKHMNLTVTDIHHNSVKLNWTKDTSDSRQLVVFIIYYKEIKDKNDINIYRGRDACSPDTWMAIEQTRDDSEAFQTFPLKDLKPYTMYAVYIQAYMLRNSDLPPISNVETFTTHPYYPSEPLDLDVSSTDPHELIVMWKPPKFPNGLVTHYKVFYQKQVLDVRSFEQRDYCSEPNSAPKETSKEKEEEAEKKQNVTASCCACPKTKEELEAEARKQEIEIYFEDYLHNQVYCQRYNTLPDDINVGTAWTDLINMERSSRARNTTNSKPIDVLVSAATGAANVSNVNNTPEMNVPQNNFTSVLREVYNSTKIILHNLEHFQEYNIEVQACHDADSHDQNGTKRCSNKAMTAGRTKPSRVMDSLNETSIDVKIVVNITTDVFISWEPPASPNSLILTYNIFYKRANQENLVPYQICVNSKDFQKNYGYHLTGLDHGNYTFQINAVSLAGNGSRTQEKYFIVPSPADEDNSTTAISIVATVVVLVIIFGAGIIMFLFVKFKIRNSVLTVISPNINYVPSDQMYTMDDWEVDRDKIKLIRELGQGSFGMVYEGIAKGMGENPEDETRVAVKTVNDRASFNDRREFLKEATTMKAFDCFHVVKLLGVVSTGQPALVIMELMALGDLKNYLREQRPDENERPGVSPPKLLDILQMAGEIADGMAYLADKKFVHRDLAARNCMVAEDKTVKIGDFGMTRDIYETDYYRKGGKGMLPVRWMAPESLKDGVFTSMSDVWSYGVVMWEMVTLAAQPYQGLSNEEVVKFVSDDSTMDIPDRCPEKLAYLMQRCWAKKPKNRPSFKDIIEYLLPHLSSHFQKVSYFFNDGGGPVQDEDIARELLGQQEGDISTSLDSLNCEGAAAPKMSLTKGNNGEYSFHGSPLPSGGSFSLYDDDLPELYTSQDRNTSHFLQQKGDMDMAEDIDGPHNISMSDSQQPFMLEDFPTTPFVSHWQTSLLSPEQSGKDSVLGGSSPLELQPLITKDGSPSPPSPRLNSLQSSSTSSDYMTHQPPTVQIRDIKTINGSKNLLLGDTIIHEDTQRTHHPSSSNPLPTFPMTSQSVPSPAATLPTLKLPTLNQAPSGGFRRSPLYKQGDKPNYSNRSNQIVSSWQDLSQTPYTAVNSSSDSKVSLAVSDQLVLPPSAVVINSSDASNNSDNFSFIKGQTNGHIPLPSLGHRTAPC